MHSSIFEKNLLLAILSNPFVSDDLRKQNLEGVNLVPQGSHFNIETKEFGLLYAEDPLEDAKKHWESIDKKHKSLIVCYGLGAAYLFDAAKEWLNAHPSRHLIFFETDKRLIAQFLHLEKASDVLNHPQVRIFPCPELPTKDENILYEYFFTKFLWAYLGQPFVLTALPVYAEKRKEEVNRFFNKFTAAYVANETSFNHLMRISYKVTINRFQNSITSSPHTPTAALEGSCRGIPAIICGAGSSIAKHLPLLKQLKDKALLFAGGTSVTILNGANVQPHVSGVVDPDPNLHNFLLQNHFEVPFFYKNRSGSEITARHHGLRLLTPDIHETNLSEWLSDELKNASDTIQNFWTVTDFLVQQAISLGCNPILFVGTDLSFTQDQYYADPNLPSVPPGHHSVEQKDIYGKPIRSKIDWISCSEKIGQIAKDHPEITFINATEGGIGFPGVPNMDFAECEKKYLGVPFDSEGFFTARILNAPLEKHDPKELLAFLKKMQKSLEESLKIVADMQKELVQLFTAWQIKSLDEMNPYEGKFKELQTQLDTEKAYEKILYPSWKIFRKSIHTLSDVLECPQKVKLTLFGMRSREFDFYESCAKSYLLISMLTSDELRQHYPEV